MTRPGFLDDLGPSLLKAAAVATLFLLGAANMRGQTPAAASRPGLAAPTPATVPGDTASDRVNGDLPGELVGIVLRTPDASQRPSSKADRGRKAPQAVSEWNRSVDYSGPRFGITYLPKAIVDTLKNHNIDVGSTISQFGWQFEREIHVNTTGPMVLNEWVFLVGGLERGVFLPSASWLVGARGRSGNEIAFGPNVSLAGVGLALAAGITVHNGGLHFPMNVAAASSRGGVRVSFLTGFTIH